MSRKYWAGVMFFSLIVTVAAATFTFSILKSKKTVEVPLARIENEDVPVSTASASQPLNAMPNPPVEEKHEPVKIDEPKKEPELNSTRNILFRYRKASAKDVFIIGSFNQWKRQAMERKANGYWEIVLKLVPGQYEYKFIVDGRKIKDPSNKLYTPEGMSILKVKALSEH